jgi:hypothetical protein
MPPTSTRSSPRRRPAGARSGSQRRPALDLGRAVAWKDGIVGRLTTGVSGLLKKAGVKSITGWARFRDGKTLEVETETGLQVVRVETVVIATGSQPIELPFLRFGDPVISSTKALALTERPERLVVVSFRQARQRGDRGRGPAAHPAALRCRADPPGGEASRCARRRGPDRRQGEAG